ALDLRDPGPDPCHFSLVRFGGIRRGRRRLREPAVRGRGIAGIEKAESIVEEEPRTFPRREPGAWHHPPDDTGGDGRSRVPRERREDAIPVFFQRLPPRQGVAQRVGPLRPPRIEEGQYLLHACLALGRPAQKGCRFIEGPALRRSPSRQECRPTPALLV